MPTNLYGPGDNYHPENSHVIPALIRKFHEAKLANAKEVVVWGTGTPRREFLYSEDMADACVFLINLPNELYLPLLAADRNDGVSPVVNIGVGNDVTIHDLAELVKNAIGYQGVVAFDAEMPDGTPRKLMDSQRLEKLGWKYSVSLAEGLKQSYADYLSSGR